MNDDLASKFKALGEPTRLAIYECLRRCGDVAVEEGDAGEPRLLSVGDVCCHFDQSMSTISHHLRELREAGLIQMRRDGRRIRCSVDPCGLEALQRFLALNRNERG